MKNKTLSLIISSIIFTGVYANANAADLLVDDFTCNGTPAGNPPRNVSNGGTHSYTSVGPVSLLCGSDVGSSRDVLFRINTLRRGNSSTAAIENSNVFKDDTGRIHLGPDMAADGSDTDYVLRYDFDTQSAGGLTKIIIKYSGGCQTDIPVTITLTSGQQIKVALKPHDISAGIQTLEVPLSVFTKYGDGSAAPIPSKLSGFRLAWKAKNANKVDFRKVLISNTLGAFCPR